MAATYQTVSSFLASGRTGLTDGEFLVEFHGGGFITSLVCAGSKQAVLTLLEETEALWAQAQNHLGEVIFEVRTARPN